MTRVTVIGIITMLGGFFLASSGCSGQSPQAAKQRLEALRAQGRLDDVSETNFVYSAFMSDLEAVTLYLATGMSPHATNQYGRTPLLAAACPEPQSPWVNRHAAVLTALLSKGADVRATDNEGQTALARAQSCGMSDTVALLKQHGATR